MNQNGNLPGSEKLTRQEMIDFQLKMAGWDVGDRRQVITEFYAGDVDVVQEKEVGYGKKQFCDYVLLGKDGKPLAVVEAKKSSVDAEVGREQAKQYCLKIEENTGRLPFCFYTNGQEIFFWDLGFYPPRKVMGFPRLEDLERYLYLRYNRKSLVDEFVDTRIAGRDYQLMAEYPGSYREPERAVSVDADHRDHFEAGRKDRRGTNRELGIRF